VGVNLDLDHGVSQYQKSGSKYWIVDPWFFASGRGIRSRSWR
jgi:hypothetical protein